MFRIDHDADEDQRLVRIPGFASRAAGAALLDRVVEITVTVR